MLLHLPSSDAYFKKRTTNLRSFWITTRNTSIQSQHRHMCTRTWYVHFSHLCMIWWPQNSGGKSKILTSPSAPDEPKHICEHCPKPMLFVGVTLRMASTRVQEYNHAVNLAISEAYDGLLSVYWKTKTKKYQRNRWLAIKHQSKHSLTNKVMMAISLMLLLVPN